VVFLDGVELLDCFIKCSQVLVGRPEEALMVGDWPERNMVGAKAVGMRTCWAKYGSFSKTSDADCELQAPGICWIF
jgi:putative hydrolase of the HAD superfamily